MRSKLFTPINQYLPRTLTLTVLLLSACHAPDVPTYAPKRKPATAIAHKDAQPRVSGAALIEVASEKGGAPVTTDGCNMDSLNDSPFGLSATVHKSEPFKVGGWLIDPTLKLVPRDAFVEFEKADGGKSWRSPANHWSQRIDVMQAFGGLRALALSGFSEQLDISTLPNGSYRVFIIYDSSGSKKKCDNGRTLTVQD